jgi:hypothetical protein
VTIDVVDYQEIAFGLSAAGALVFLIRVMAECGKSLGFDPPVMHVLFHRSIA